MPVWKLSPAAAVRGAFLVQALCIGGFFSRLADMQLAMHATPAELGFGLIGFDVGAFFTFPFAAKLIERIGTRRTLLYGLPAFGLAIACTTLAPNVPAFFLVSLFIGIGFTCTAIGMNVEADRVEAATGRRILNSCHGTWSLGFFLASLIGTGVVALGVPRTVHLFCAVPIVTAITLAFLLPMRESPPRPQTGEQRAPRFAIPTVATVMIMAFAFGSVWLEAAARSWSVIYMRDLFVGTSWVANSVLPIWVGAQVIGRFFADGWIERFGPVRVAMVLSAISFVGLVLVVFGNSVPIVLAGFVLVGLGVATAYPQALSAAARLGDRPAAENVASVSMMNSFLIFLAPPVMGFAASQWGLRTTFGLILPLLLLAVVLSRNLAERRPSPAAA